MHILDLTPSFSRLFYRDAKGTDVPCPAPRAVSEGNTCRIAAACPVPDPEPRAECG